MELQDFAEQDHQSKPSFADTLPKELIKQIQDNPHVKPSVIVRWLQSLDYPATRGNVGTLMLRIKNGTI